MRRLILAIFCIVSTLLLLGGPVANAAPFNANNLIDDQVFSDTTTMSAGQIDAFLNTFPNSCISPNSGFAAIDPIGYNPSNGYSYGGYVTAGQVIYDAAQAYGINPQVLLTTLQKEQSLVAGGVNFCENGDMNKYAAAVGYGCPDSGTTYSYTGVSLYRRNGVVASNTGITCVNSASKAGFSQQVIRAAWLLKFGQQRSEGNIGWAVIKGNWNNSDDPQTCYGGPMTQGNFQRCPSGATVSYDGYTTIDGTSVHMDNGATAALYWYTPHFHGNQSFDNIFQSWFGSLIGSDLVRTVNDATVYLTSGTTRYPIADGNLLNDFSALGSIKFVNDTYMSSFTAGPILTHMVGGPDGTLYFVNAGIKLPFPSCAMVTDYGYSCGSVNQLTSAQLSKLATGPLATSRYNTTSGKQFYIAGGQKREIFDTTSANQAGISAVPNTLLEGGIAYLPYGAPVIRDHVVATSRSTASQYYYEGGAFYGLKSDIASLSAFKDLTQSSLDDASIPSANRNGTFTGLVKNSAGTSFYVLLPSGKAAISSPSSWPNSAFTPLSDNFITNAPSDTSGNINSALVKSSSNGTVYYVTSATKRPIPSWNDLVGLHTQPLAINTLPDTVLGAVPTGNLVYAPGAHIKSANSSTVYVVDNLNSVFTISSFAYPTELGLPINIATVSDSLLATYTVTGPLTNKVSCNSNNYVGIGGLMYLVTSSMMTTYGYSQANFTTSGSLCTNLGLSTRQLTDFIRTQDGTIYHIESGQKRGFTSYAAYVAHGGTSSNTIQVSNYFASSVPSGALISQ